MSKYFHVATGLRGLYMPNHAYMIKTDTRRKLKAVLEGEAYDIRDTGFYYLTKKAVATLAADIWTNATSKKPNYINPIVAGYGNRGNPCFGLMVTLATRNEWLAYIESEGE